jgi:hypothetical protein
LDAPPSSKELGWLARENTSALEALPKRRFAREVTNGELPLAPAFCKLALVANEAGFVDGDPTLAALRQTARFNDSACLSLFARPILGRDLQALETRFRLITARERDRKRRDPTGSSPPPHLMPPTEAGD